MDRLGASPTEIPSESANISHERRRGRRHKIVTPAYANRGGSSQGAILELNEILNISESGMCMQAASAMPVGRLLPLGIDLSTNGEAIHTVGYVAWSEPSGKTGIQFPEIAEGLRAQLRRWLGTNAQPASASGQDERGDAELGQAPSSGTSSAATSAARASASLATEWTEIEKEIGECGADTEASLHVVAQRALTLTRANGVAIALIDPQDTGTMICRARAGTDAPGMGARLEAGSGFSGECVRSAATLKCDDSESDVRVDRESCRALGIRSIVASPVKREGKVIGILEVFSREPDAFPENEVMMVERLAGMVERAAGADVLKFPESGASAANSAGTALTSLENPEVVPRRRLGRGILLLLIGVVCIGGAVWLGTRWIAERRRAKPVVVPVSSSTAAPAHDTYIGADLKDVQSHADAGDAAAEYELGVRYASGVDVKQDYGEAMRWFLQAADVGNVRAQGVVATWMWVGRGAAQDYSKAYYWALLAQAGGDESGRAIVLNSAPYLSPAQTAAAQRQAENWLHGHHIGKGQ